jgi:cytochrome c oxidase assembly factor CtaG
MGEKTVLRVTDRARSWGTRMVLGMVSAVLALAVGVGEGADTLGRHSFAPLVHAALFVVAAGVLGVLTVSVTGAAREGG